MIARFHQALRELTRRRGIRNDVSRYEAISLGLVEPGGDGQGHFLAEFPPPDSTLRFEHFFNELYLRYDERYVYGAPELASGTRRLEWSPLSPAFQLADHPHVDYRPRVGPA